MKIMKGDKN